MSDPMTTDRLRKVLEEQPCRCVKRLEYTCPSCGGPVDSTGHGPSWMNSEQWSASKAGDFFCKTCKDPGTKTGFKYWRDSDMPTTITRACTRCAALAEPVESVCASPSEAPLPWHIEHNLSQLSSLSPTTPVETRTEWFYILNRGFCGNSLRWWKVDGGGYTSDLREAWKVDRATAEKYHGRRKGYFNEPEDVAYPANLVESLVEHHVTDLATLQAATPWKRVTEEPKV